MPTARVSRMIMPTARVTRMIIHTITPHPSQGIQRFALTPAPERMGLILADDGAAKLFLIFSTIAKG